MQKKPSISITQPNRKNENKNYSHLQQLLLPLASQRKPATETKLFSDKPQIVSIPGVPPKEQHRYRVTFGSQILGERLTLDEALKLAKGGEG
jgi:hypothetical protein